MDEQDTSTLLQQVSVQDRTAESLPITAGCCTLCTCNPSQEGDVLSELHSSPEGPTSVIVQPGWPIYIHQREWQSREATVLFNPSPTPGELQVMCTPCCPPSRGGLPHGRKRQLFPLREHSHIM